MKPDNEAGLDVVELGAATQATRGPWGHFADDVLMQEMAGLASD
jgi:hypothetical protein